MNLDRISSEGQYRKFLDIIPVPVQEIDLNGIIIYANPAYHYMLGYSENELVGKPVYDLIPYPAIIEDLKNFISALREKMPEPEPWHDINVTRNGTIIDVTVYWNYKRDEYGQITGFISMIYRNDPSKTGDSAINDVREKGELVRELHDRVKNNLQFVSSLLSLKCEFIQNKEAIKILRESQERIQNLAVIHELIYQQNTYVNIELDQIIRLIVYEMTLDLPEELKDLNVKLKLEEIKVNLREALPLAMILGELFTNSVQHAFPEPLNKEPLIEISLHRDENSKIVMLYRDNGIGIDKNREMKLGYLLVDSMIKQLNGKCIKRNRSEVAVSFMQLR